MLYARPNFVKSLTAATATITEADHEGFTLLLDRAAGQAITLPAATGSGKQYRFVVHTTITSNSTTIKAASASDSFYGNQVVLADGGNTLAGFEVAANDDTVTLNGSTTGGIRGDEFIFTDVATGLFYVKALTSGTGTEATSFSATVS